MRRRFARTLWSAAAGLTLLLLGASTAARADENEFNREGAYAGVTGVFALDDSTGSLDTSSGGGFSIVGGYRMVPELAFELEGGWVDVGGTNFGEIEVNLKLYLFELFGFDLGRFQAFGMGSAGVAFGDIDGDNNVGGRFGGGGGFEVYATENIAISATGQYVGTSGGISDLRFGRFTLGALYRW